MLMLSSVTGSFRIRRILDEGKLGAVSDSGDLGAGWSTGLPYGVTGSSYLLLCNRSTGNLRIRMLRADGTLGGATTDRRTFGGASRAGTGWGWGPAS